MKELIHNRVNADKYENVCIIIFIKRGGDTLVEKEITVDHVKVRVFCFNTIIVGSGAAGLNAADTLWKLGQKDIAIVTEGMLMGTSRNTGSDKQTYYKLTTSGEEADSVRRMAQTLFSGGAMDGDIALAEAAVSTQAFYHLVDIGVPFPHNAYGEYVGYKTDHDPCKRGTSAGPLTSKFMTQCLQQEVENKQIKVFDGFQVVEILTTGTVEEKRAVGLIALDIRNVRDKEKRYVVFSATNIVYATGGEAGMYKTSVYPVSQTGGSGVAFRAGVKGKNLTESQYGIASIKFRWNLSGTYQQVIPRYISTDADGNDEKEFLDEYFADSEKLLTAIFLKGYQWPFDPRKVENNGSSLIDILVYNETVVKNRRVFLDFTRNPACSEEHGKVDFSKMGQEAYEYLANSKALLATPIERLEHMNMPAIELYKAHGIDLYTEKLEIAVCSQHNNGGLDGNKWWESNIAHFFPVGEVNGSHGIYRPGGSALNSGQVGSIRASQYIAQNYTESPLDCEDLHKVCQKQLKDTIRFGESAMEGDTNCIDVRAEKQILAERMSRLGAHIRSLAGVRQGAEEALTQLTTIESRAKIKEAANLPLLFRLRDLLTSQFVYFNAIVDYIQAGGGSRGSYLILDMDGLKPSDKLGDAFAYKLDKGDLSGKIQEVSYETGKCSIQWRDVRPLPPDDNWFENVWKDYLNRLVIR